MQCFHCCYWYMDWKKLLSLSGNCSIGKILSQTSSPAREAKKRNLNFQICNSWSICTQHFNIPWLKVNFKFKHLWTIFGITGQPRLQHNCFPAAKLQRISGICLALPDHISPHVSLAAPVLHKIYRAWISAFEV